MWLSVWPGIGNVGLKLWKASVTPLSELYFRASAGRVPNTLCLPSASPLSREAAKECRRRKKEYVKCLESRVAVLEVQNKKLIEELEALKDFCSPKAD